MGLIACISLYNKKSIYDGIQRYNNRRKLYTLVKQDIHDEHTKNLVYYPDAYYRRDNRAQEGCDTFKRGQDDARGYYSTNSDTYTIFINACKKLNFTGAQCADLYCAETLRVLGSTEPFLKKCYYDCMKKKRQDADSASEYNKNILLNYKR